MAAAIGDDGIAGGAGELGGDQVDGVAQLEVTRFPPAFAVELGRGEVDRLTLDVRDAGAESRTEGRRGRRAERLATGDVMDTRRDHHEADGGGRPLGERGGEGEQAGEGRQPAGCWTAGRRTAIHAGSPDGAQMRDAERLAVFFSRRRQRREQAGPVRGRARRDLVAVGFEGREAGARHRRRHPPPFLPQASGEARREAAAVAEDQPAARPLAGGGQLAPPPGGDRCLAGLRYRGRRRAGRRGLDPVPLALERIGRQRHAAPALAGVQALPVDPYAGRPQSPERSQQVLLVRPRVAPRRQRGGDRPRVAAGQPAPGERRQGGAGADLEERQVRLREQRAERVSEADGAPQVLDPVAGVGRLAGADPAAAQAREVRQARRRQRHLAQARREVRQDGLHRRRVEGAPGVEAPALDAERGQPAGHRGDGVERAGEHRVLRPVDRRELDTGADERPDLRLRQAHRQHGAGRRPLHQLAARGDEVEGILEREDAGEVGRRILAQAVPEHRARPHAPAHPQARQGGGDDKEGGLRQGGIGEALRRRAVRGERREEQLSQVETEPRPQQLGAAVDVPAEDGGAGIEVGAHAGVMNALAGEEKGDATLRRRLVDAALAGGPQPGERLAAVAADDGAAMGEAPPPHLQGVGGIGEIAQVSLRIRLRRALEVIRQVRRRRRQRRGAAGRDRQQEGRSGGVARLRRRLFEDGVRVGAADPERRDAGAPRRRPGRPRAECRVDEKRARREVDLGVRPPVVEGGRDLAVPQRQSGLDQAGDPRRGVEVAEVGLHRAHGAEAAAAGAGAEGLGERRDLDRIAERRAGAVCLDVADGLRRDSRHALGLGDDRRLPGDAGGREADLVAAVVVHRRAAHHGGDRIAGGERVVQALEHHHGDAVAGDGAAGGGVEGAAVAVGRGDPPLAVEIAGAQRQPDGDAAGEGEVALALEQAAAGEVDGDQRRRAGALHRHARPLQVQLVGGAGGEVVLVVAEQHRHVAHRLDQLRMREQVAQIAGEAGPGVEPDQAAVAVPAVALGGVAGVLQRLPRGLQEEPLLGVEQLRLARREAEEAGVEEVGAGERPARRHVARIGEQAPVDPRRSQLAGAPTRDRFDAGTQVAPQLGDARGAREAAGHADDGDVWRLTFAAGRDATRAAPRRRRGGRLGGFGCGFEVGGERAHGRVTEQLDHRHRPRRALRRSRL